MSKSLATGFQAHLDTGTTTLCTCWKITRRDGQVLGFTDHDVALTVDSQTYNPTSAYTASDIEGRGDLSVPNLELVGVLEDAAITDDDLLGGAYDHAEVEALLVNWADVSQYVALRRGWIGEVSAQDGFFSAELRGLPQALQQRIGEVISPTCRADLGDIRCGVPLATHTVTGTITSITDKTIFRDSSRGEAADYFAYGVIEFATGTQNAGLSMEVKSSATDGTFTVVAPLRNLPATGDAYTAIRGCNRLATTCTGVFSNIENFIGEPFLAGVDELGKFGRQ